MGNIKAIKIIYISLLKTCRPISKLISKYPFRRQTHQIIWCNILLYTHSSIVPDQTAEEAVWSGSTLFEKASYVWSAWQGSKLSAYLTQHLLLKAYNLYLMTLLSWQCFECNSFWGKMSPFGIYRTCGKYSFHSMNCLTPIFQSEFQNGTLILPL